MLREKRQFYELGNDNKHQQVYLMKIPRMPWQVLYVFLASHIIFSLRLLNLNQKYEKFDTLMDEMAEFRIILEIEYDR